MILSVGENMEQFRHSYTAGGNVKWFNSFGKVLQFITS